MTQKPLALAVLSGGLDSTTMVYELIEQGYQVDCVSFNYGQRHKKELKFAASTCAMLNLKHDTVDLSGLTHLISNSALTSGRAETPSEEFNNDFNQLIDVPEGHYAEDTMAATVVPNRNMIMISIAAGIAVNRQAKTIGVGVHSGDHFVYPDCRPEFIFAAGQAIIMGNMGFHNFDIEFDPEDPKYVDLVVQGWTRMAKPLTTPFMESSKADIAFRALELGVPLFMTWSCYKGGDNHCGRCGTCVERLEAIDEAQKRWVWEKPGMSVPVDQTVYDDEEYWQVVVHEAKKATAEEEEEEEEDEGFMDNHSEVY